MWAGNFWQDFALVWPFSDRYILTLHNFIFVLQTKLSFDCSNGVLLHYKIIPLININRKFSVGCLSHTLVEESSISDV